MSRRRPAPDVRSVLVRWSVLVALRTAVCAVVLVASAAVAGSAGGGVRDAQRAWEHPSRIERLVAGHDCWSGAAPAGAEPHHAVVTRPGGRARVVAARVGFGIWLGDAPGVLHAFCR